MNFFKEPGVPLVSYLWDDNGYPLFVDTDDEEKALVISKERFNELFDFTNDMMFKGTSKETLFASLETVSEAYKLVKLPAGTNFRGEICEFELDEHFVVIQTLCFVI